MANELKKEKTPKTDSTVEEMKPRPKHLFMGKFYFGLGEILCLARNCLLAHRKPIVMRKRPNSSCLT